MLNENGLAAWYQRLNLSSIRDCRTQSEAWRASRSRMSQATHSEFEQWHLYTPTFPRPSVLYALTPCDWDTVRREPHVMRPDWRKPVSSPCGG